MTFTKIYIAVYKHLQIACMTDNTNLIFKFDLTSLIVFTNFSNDHGCQ